MSVSSKAKFEHVGQRFRMAAAEEDLADLAERLRRTRLPKIETGSGWSAGTTIDFAERLLRYWRDDFDWRAQESRFNRFDHRLVDIDGQMIHVLVEPGSGADPLPLLLANGWPSSFVEFDKVIERLAHPERYGGRIEDAFTVVIPSMPGYGFSPPPLAPSPVQDFATLWDRLMVSVFGVDRYVAVGSDWGSILVSTLAFGRSEHLRAVLLTTAGGFIDPAHGETPPSSDELAWLGKMSQMSGQNAYQAIQATKSQSLAFGQTDSPLGLAAWITEKFQVWTCPGTENDPPFSMDDLISNVMIYWLNGCAAAMWPYAFLKKAIIPVGANANVPAGFMFFPADMSPAPPQCYLERAYDVKFYHVHEKGGHFPAQEVPDLFVDDVTTFFRQFR
jgi:pimeloyl-ACP methyl ester carboxylesterase